MSLTVVGSIAFDAVQTPFGKRDRMLGGAATHFALSASFFDEVRAIGPVGDDFDDAAWASLRTRQINTDDVEQIPGGKTFFWSGVYSENLNERETLQTDLNVFETFQPKLSDAAAACDVLFLANIQPDLQAGVRAQCTRAKFVAMDSMNLWIDITRDSLVSVIKSVDCLILNDEELEQLTGKPLVAACQELLTWGPSAIIAKQGKYGAALFTKNDYFALPAYPMVDVVDPTGAGDSFAGGFVGYVAAALKAGTATGIGHDLLCTAMAYGTSLASYNVQDFGTERVQRLTAPEVQQRVTDLQRMTTFDAAPVPLRA